MKKEKFLENIVLNIVSSSLYLDEALKNHKKDEKNSKQKLFLINNNFLKINKDLINFNLKG
ncbi:hypothetical protein [Campylobacter ureolyticus]|uniref:Uncharacterized protein n=1 Tax=Campylobacter ureolyticus TaxID=827 RepID=A0A9Q4KKK9_9BACT|nr:hypothetical protein [Campylobacter ureolyticus]MCZ6135296.1 hypothetical protein [Campylobacter ureolyticus]MCZ6159329.1 hypothetical protein [Campylobacter ureolyticus]MCZ6171228.1 hypothetical protein [Campylobacter ureolyticus]